MALTLLDADDDAICVFEVQDCLYSLYSLLKSEDVSKLRLSSVCIILPSPHYIFSTRP
jgi:hypothetical protein